MSGKKKFSLFILTFVLYYVTNTVNTLENGNTLPGFLYSGLLYEHIDVERASLLLNPDTLTFSRKLDVTTIALAVRQLQAASLEYTKLCANITTQIKQEEESNDDGFEHYEKYTVPPELVQLRLARKICKRYGASLPEIKDLADLKELQSAAERYGIHIVPSNAQFDPTIGRIIYNDGTDLFRYRHLTTVYNYGQGQGHNTTNPEDYYFVEATKNYIIAYKDFTENKVTIRALDVAEMNSNAHILCYNPKPVQKIVYKRKIDKLTQFICQRDTAFYTNATVSIFEAADSLFNISNILKKVDEKNLLQKSVGLATDKESDTSRTKRGVNDSIEPLVLETSPKSFVENYNESGQKNASVVSRKKRLAFLPMLAVGGASAIVAANAASNLGSDTPPMSWVGGMLAKTFGWMTRDEMKQQAEAILRQSEQISELVINVDEISLQLENHRIAVQEIQDYINNSESALLTYFRLQDLANHLQLVLTHLQITISSIVSLMADTAASLYNPSVLTASELVKLKSEMMHKNIDIDIEAKRIKTNLIMADNYYYLLITFNVISTDDIADIFKISEIPLFINGKSYRPVIDAKYVAFYISGTHYSVVDQEEANKCAQNSNNCRISSAKIPYSDTSLCVVQTHKLKTLKCKLRETNETKPYFYLYGNNLIYSTQNTTAVIINCKVSNDDSQRKNNDVLYLNEMGHALLKPGCQLVYPDGRTMRTSPLVQTLTLTESKMTSILAQIPHIQLPALVEDEVNIPFKKLGNFQLQSNTKPSNITEILIHSLQPHNVATFGIQVTFLVVTILALTILLCCCCKSYRVWLTTCLQLRPSTQWFNHLERSTTERSSAFNRMVSYWLKKGRARDASTSMDVSEEIEISHDSDRENVLPPKIRKSWWSDRKWSEGNNIISSDRVYQPFKPVHTTSEKLLTSPPKKKPTLHLDIPSRQGRSYLESTESSPRLTRTRRFIYPNLPIHGDWVTRPSSRQFMSQDDSDVLVQTTRHETPEEIDAELRRQGVDEQVITGRPILGRTYSEHYKSPRLLHAQAQRVEPTREETLNKLLPGYTEKAKELKETQEKVLDKLKSLSVSHLPHQD